MTRDEFEAAIWRTFPAATVAQVDAILDAADALAATTAAVAVEMDGKRQRPAAVHYLGTGGQPACGYGRGMAGPALTGDPGQTTCGACKRTAGYRQARALAVAS